MRAEQGKDFSLIDIEIDTIQRLESCSDMFSLRLRIEMMEP